MTGPEWQRVREVFEDAVVRRPEARAAFLDAACAADTGLRGEVESLLAAHERAGAFLSGPVPLDDPLPDAQPEAVPSRRVGPYRVLGVIGQGGMGTVYRAVRDDDAFQKTVALKLVRGGAASEFARRRFLQERQILARLQHPNIATILDGGTTAEGQPYLAMEYVEGRPLTAYCDEQRLGTRPRLAMFGSVCAAVQYAHQNLVIHRDLKPDNILVTADGAPKLLDFGIAKLLAAGVDPETAPTATLLPMMTPEYASPEQVRGEPVTTATDVYSLGVLLYELLAGQRPYAVKSESLEEIVQAVCRTEPPPPSAAARTAGARAATGELKGDLDTIVLKALQKEPARRYGSVQEMAEDVQRHLDGRPVRARGDTLGYRAGKFIKRHRVAASATAVVAASLAAGIVGTVRQRHLAEAERARAERRFAEVRQLANSFLFEFEAAIRDLPGSTPARQLVVKKALQHLDGLAREAAGDRRLQAELADAYRKLGDVQGNPYGANLGDTSGAIASYRKEVAIRETLGAGKDRPAARDLIAAYRRLGLLEDEAGQTPAAIQRLQRALDLGQRLSAEDPQDHKARRLLAQVHDGAGLLALKTGEHRAAEEHQRRALAIWEAEVQAAAEDQEALRGLHVAHGDLARTLRVTGRLAEAERHYREALEVAARRLRLAPADATARRDESNAQTNLAVALYKQREFDQAVALVARSLAFDEEMLRADPQNSQVQRDVSWDLGFLAELAAAQGKAEQALSYQERSLAMDLSRAQANPGSFQARKDLAENWSSVSDRLGRLGRLDAALTASRRSLALFEELSAANPGQTRVEQLMAVQYGRQGEVLQSLAARAGAAGDGAAARRHEGCAAFRRSLELWRGLETKGASIDDENRPRRAEMEQQIGRCPVLATIPGRR